MTAPYASANAPLRFPAQHGVRIDGSVKQRINI